MVAAEVSTVSTAWAVFSVIGGSILGGAISTLVSFMIQRKNINAAKAQREVDRFEVRKSLGFSLFYKLIQISSEMNNSAVAIQECIEKGKSVGFTELYQMVQPIVPIAEKIKFSPEEMALVLSVDSKLFNQISALDNLHNSTVWLFDMYLSRRTAIMERFGATMAGNIGTTGLTENEKNWLAPRAVELNSLVSTMYEQARNGAKLTWAALENLHSMLEKNFGLEKKLERHPDIPVAD